MYNTITLKQAADLIAAVGDQQTVLVQGEMGIGKSAILKMLKGMPQFKNYFFCYVDITTKDVGDFLVPMIKDLDGNDVCRFVPNEEFGLHFKDKKVIVFKMKAKKHYRRKAGHRQAMTRFLVTKVEFGAATIPK